MEILSVRIDAATKRRLEALAGSTASTKSKLAAAALREYLERHEWQINAIVAGLHAIDEERCVAHEALRHEVLDTGVQQDAAPESGRQPEPQPGAGPAPEAQAGPVAPQADDRAPEPQTVAVAVAERAAAVAEPRADERSRRLGTVFASFVRRGVG
jgi:predicted transcriptional regulator